MIEVLLVVAIFGIMVALAVTTYVGAAGAMKVRGAARELNGALQLAKMRAMVTGIPHGVAIDRANFYTAPGSPCYYMIFADCNRDLKFTGASLFSSPLYANPGTCTGADQQLAEKRIVSLDSGICFTTFLGSKGTGSDLDSLVFDAMGMAFNGGSGSIADGNIFIQSDAEMKNGTVNRAGVVVRGMTGITDTIPMDAVAKDAWK
jgi:type II secretory pathway pseudopilin PulG